MKNILEQWMPGVAKHVQAQSAYLILIRRICFFFNPKFEAYSSTKRQYLPGISMGPDLAI